MNGPGAFLRLRPTLASAAKGRSQLSGPVGCSTNLRKTDIKRLSSRDAARRAEIVRVVSSTISIKRPMRSTSASPIAR